MSCTVAQVIAQQIVERGVPRVYQVPGESFLDVLDTLRDTPVQIVTARQEGGAGYMAMAEARMTGRAGVALVTRGPGAGNIQLAVHTAYQDGTPLVVFVGLIPTADRDRESFQEFDPRAWFGSTAKAVMVLDCPDTAGDVVARAFEIAESGYPGPVIVGLPEDRLGAVTENCEVVPKRKRAARTPAEEHVAEFVQQLNSAERPIFVVGGESWNAESADLLRRIAEAASVPVVSDFRSHDIFPHSAEPWIGSLGYGTGELAAATYRDADLICYLGTSRKDVLSAGYTAGANAQTIVVVNPDTTLFAHAGRLDLHAEMLPEEWLRAIDVNQLSPLQTVQDRLAELRHQYIEWSTPKAYEGADLDVEGMFAELCEMLPENIVVTAGAGNYTVAPSRFLKFSEPRSLFVPRNGAMGGGIPAAVAATLVHTDKTVLAFAGDGCFGMNGQELAVLEAYRGRAIIFVFDNGGYGTIRNHQERNFPGRPSGTYLINPNFVDLAEAHGIAGHRVETMEEARNAVRAATSSAKSSLIHVILPQIAEGSGLTDGTKLAAR